MKKIVSLGLVITLAVSLAACGAEKEVNEVAPEASVSTEASVETPASVEEVEEAPVVEENTEVEAEEVEETAAAMTYAEYVAAEEETEVTVECYVQAHQSWWDGKVTVYAADEDGAYFFYNMACTEEDAAKLVPGTKIKATGFKTSWSGEVEIADATFEFVDGDSFVAEAKDLTNLIGSDDLITYQNQLVAFNGVTVEAVSYKNNEPGDDVYVTVSKDEVSMETCLEYYLNGSDEEFYNLVGNLEVGSVIDIECYLYWYEGADGHLTKVVVK